MVCAVRKAPLTQNPRVFGQRAGRPPKRDTKLPVVRAGYRQTCSGQGMASPCLAGEVGIQVNSELRCRVGRALR